MATFVQSNNTAEVAGPTNQVTIQWDSNTTTGNCAVVFVFWKNDVTISSVTDSQTNSYSDCGAGRVARPTDGYVQILGAKNITGGTTPTVTVNFSGNAVEISTYVAEYSGCNKYLLFGAYGSGTATSGPNVTTGSFTPGPKGVIVAFAVSNAPSGAAADITGGFTEREYHPDYPRCQAIADKVFSSSPGSTTVTGYFVDGFTKAIIIAAEILDAGVYYDYFDGDQNPLAGNWTVGFTSYPACKVSGYAKATDINKGCCAYYSAGTFADDHYSEILIATVIDANHCPGVTLRLTGQNSTLNGYTITLDTTTIYIEKYTNGTWSSITTRSITIGVGDKFKASIHNSGPSQVLRFWKNGTQVGTDLSDSSFQSGGKPGITVWDNTGHTNDARIDSWEGGDVTLGVGVNTNITPWTTLYEGP